jgi:hypothetical protein
VLAQAVCSRCGFVLVEQRIARGGRRPVRGPGPRRPTRPSIVPAAAGLLAAAAASLVLLAAPIGRGPSSDPLSAADAERRLALRYPHLRHSDDAVIACPDRAIAPGGAARCWILARVGLQRAVTVRLSQRGNQIEIED